MADRNPKVMEMVEREVRENPDANVDSMFAKAKEIDPGLAELDKRQFHARYTLRAMRGRGGGAKKKAAEGAEAKRRGGRKRAAARGGKRAQEAPVKSEAAAPAAAPAKRRRGRGAGSPAEGRAMDREAVRRIFLDFAGEFARAGSPAEIVDLLSSVDRYVDRVEKLAR